MLHKISPEPMENSSGYVSNTNSMNPTVKYATVGRNRPGGVKRTSSLVVTQPVVPPPLHKVPAKLAPGHRDVRKHYKNDLSRPSSQASRSSANSGSRRPSSRGSRDAPSERLARQRGGSRRSHSKVRRPESRTSSKALIMRRRDSGRERSTYSRPVRADEHDYRPSSRTSQASHRSRAKRDSDRSKSIFSWKPRLTLRRSKSLQVKPEPAGKREIRFGDESRPGVVMMKGVEHRRYDSSSKSYTAREAGSDVRSAGRSHTSSSDSPEKHTSQSPTRPAKRTSPPSRSQRASSAEASRRLAPVGESPQENDSPRTRQYRSHEPSRGLSPGKQRASSELSSSPSPRAPVWRDSSDGSLSDTLTNHSVGSTILSYRPATQHDGGRQRSRSKRSDKSDRKREGEPSSVMNFLRRTFSIKPRDKPKPSPVKKRERASSSSLSSLERPVRHSKLKTAKSHETLTVSDRERDEKKRYRSLPRGKHKHAGGTTLSRRLSSLGWTAGGRPHPERSHSFKEERTFESRVNNAPRDERDAAPRNNERVPLTYPPIPPKVTNEATRGRPPRHVHDPPIRPILQERRALSQPSLYHPPAEPSDEPFSHYANLPFQLPPRRRSSPNLLADAGSPSARRAASQPSLLARRSASPASSHSSSTLYAPDRAHWKSGGGGRHQPGKGILKQQRSAKRADVKNVNVTRNGTLTRKPRRQRPSVFHDIAQNIKNVFRHRKSGDKSAPDGYVPASGDSVVSERFVNVTNTHEEHETTRQDEHVHHLGDVSHEELTRAIRDGVDARQLVRSETSGGRQDQLEPRRGQHRLLHQSARTWRTVDTDNVHETSRHDRHGELVTESARTHQRELFQNVEMPDDGGDEREEVRSSSHNRRHTKDVDMVEHFSLPRGGRLGDGIKLGDGLRYVQENVEGDRQGDEDVGSLSERMQELRQLDLRPDGQTSTPIEYYPEEKTKRKQTGSWVNNHTNRFDSESIHSKSSEDEARTRSSKKGRDESDRRRSDSGRRHGESEKLRETHDRRREAPDIYRETANRHRESADRHRESADRHWEATDRRRESVDRHHRESAERHWEAADRRHKDSERHRETSTYEYQKSSGTMQKGSAPPTSWERSEKYTKEVRQTPERTYIKETRESPRGGYERVQMLPPSRHTGTALMSDLQSEVDEDPIFASKFSSGKPRGGVPFGGRSAEGKEKSSKQTGPVSPSTASPPPSPPPRHKRKNRLKQTPPQPVPPPAPPPPPAPIPDRSEWDSRAAPGSQRRREDAHEVSSRVTRDVTPIRFEDRRSFGPETVQRERIEDGRLVKEYHFRSCEGPTDGPVYREYRETSSTRRDSPQRPVRRGSPATRDSPPHTTYFGQRDRSHSTDEPAPRDARYTTTLHTRLGGDRRYHKSFDELDRRSAEPMRAHTIDRRIGATRQPVRDHLQSQTLPRKPRESPPSSRDSRLAGTSHLGGSMINVSVRNNTLGSQPASHRPASSQVRRSSSLYLREGRPAQPPADVGLKSPDIISQIQRTASIRRGCADPPPTTAADDTRRQNSENERRSSAEPRSHVIPVSVDEPPRAPRTKVPPKVAPKPRPAVKENFMRGLMQTAPELYSALHSNERKDSKTPSPKQSPPLTPPPPLHRARSPASPQPLTLDYGVIYPKTPPVFKRIERLRADEEVVTKDGRSRSSTPVEDVHNFRMITMSPTGERSDVIKVQR